MQRSSFIPNRTWLKKRSCAPAHTSHLVTVPAGYNLLACLTFFGCSPVIRVELELNLGVKCAPHATTLRSLRAQALVNGLDFHVHYSSMCRKHKNIVKFTCDVAQWQCSNWQLIAAPPTPRSGDGWKEPSLPRRTE